MSTNTRVTLASTNARIDTIEAKLDAILAHLEPTAPARKPAKKAPAKKAPAKPATKGAQTRATLSRKDWNRTVTAKARFAGGDTYKRVLANWALVQECAARNETPDQALAHALGNPA
jgi:hypothetical protein